MRRWRWRGRGRGRGCRCNHSCTFSTSSSSSASSSVPRISIAPMVDVTDAHCRHLLRILSRSAHLYTPMLVDRAVLDDESLLNTHTRQPLSIQLGGSQLSTLSQAVKLISSSAARSYSEININCGCPAPSAQRCEYGVRLMTQPESLASTLSHLHAHTTLPITVKCRLGVDENTDYSFLHSFITHLYHTAHIRHFIIHCRPALLHLNTKHNRVIPALDYTPLSRLHHDKSSLPGLRFEVNGGIDSAAKVMRWIEDEEQIVDGVMIGRWAYKDIWQMRHIDQWIHTWKTHRQQKHGTAHTPAVHTQTSHIVQSREQVIDQYLEYLCSLPPSSHSISRLSTVRPLLSLYAYQPGATEWRHRLLNGVEQALSPELIVMKARDFMQQSLLERLQQAQDDLPEQPEQTQREGLDLSNRLRVQQESS